MTPSKYRCPHCGADLRTCGVTLHDQIAEVFEYMEGDVIHLDGTRDMVWHKVDEEDKTGYFVCNNCNEKLPATMEFEPLEY